MKRTLALAVFASLLLTAAVAQQQEDGSRTDAFSLAVEKDSGKDESKVDLREPRTVTICSDGLNPLQVSVDGKHWHKVELGDECRAVPPVRYVKLTRTMNDSSHAEVYTTY